MLKSFFIIAGSGGFLAQQVKANILESFIHAEQFAEVSAFDRLRCHEPMERFAEAQPDFQELLAADGKWTDPAFD